MPLRHIQIVDGDPTAALVTRLGLEARLKGEAEISIATLSQQDQPPQHHLNGHGNGHEVDLLIVDPGAQFQAATRLVRTLRTDCPCTPVLVLTAYDSPLLRTQMRSLGVRQYLAKPIDLLDLEQAVRDLLVLDTAAVS
jgi:DNA-binding NarL/FixJ family response regulator